MGQGTTVGILPWAMGRPICDLVGNLPWARGRPIYGQVGNLPCSGQGPGPKNYKGHGPGQGDFGLGPRQVPDLVVNWMARGLC